MGNCATCCGKADTHEIDTTEKVRQNNNKLKSEAGYPGGADIVGNKRGPYGGIGPLSLLLCIFRRW
jgi:hypothetical protein